MRKIVECVPNFSEGRDQGIIAAIGKAMADTPGCAMLDIDPGASTNRTVYTFVGEPEAVLQGALNGARVARELIDMRRHQGEHPRIGALDVCPFVPVANVSMEECVQLAREFGRRAAEELGIPVFLYEEAAPHPYRRTLPQIRKGEYEGLAERLADPRWKPDFGPAEFLPSWGATAAGARFFLIAYNVNLLGTTQQAHQIAQNLRTRGRGPGQPGRLPEVRGMGWYVDEYHLAQVSANLTNYQVTPMHLFFEEVRTDAAALQVEVVGSEVVGVLPLQALLAAADYYINKEGLFVIEEDQKVRLAINRLGLDAVAPFDPRKKIIEYLMASPREKPLTSLSLREFIAEVAASSPAPGGGSVSAGLAAMGTGLGAMAAGLTQSAPKFKACEALMRQALTTLQETVNHLIPMVDADAKAFEQFSQALRLPRNTPEEKSARNEMMQKGLVKAVEAPLGVMRLADRAWPALRLVAEHANIACRSDIQVGARALETGIWGAGQNVLINLEGIKDESFREASRQEAQALAQRASLECQQVLELLAGR